MEPDNQPQQQQQAQVRLSRTYPVAAEKVWRAWTDPQALTQWFGPARGKADVKAAEIDLREGGHFRFNFNLPDGDNNEASGVYQQVQPHQNLVFSWAWRSTPERVSRISITLTPVAGGTELLFVHDRFFDLQARDNHAKGWPMFLDSLDHFLEPSTTSTTTQEA